MKYSTKALLAILIPLLTGGCSERTKNMTYGQFRRLPEEERMKAQKALSSDELQNFVTVATGNRFDSVSLDQLTLRDLIAEGQKIRARIEPTSPTK